MSIQKIIGIIFLSAVITFAMRALPFLIFREKRELPEKIKQLGKNLPPAIMAVLIVYCLKDVKSSFLANGIWEFVAVAIVAITYKWKHNTFLSIFLGTAGYMILLRV